MKQTTELLFCQAHKNMIFFHHMNMLKNKFISFTIFAIITYSASFIGSLATFSYKEPWYSTLNKSVLTPPDWVFAPVWTTLYLFMALAIWLAWHKNYNITFIARIGLELRFLRCGGQKVLQKEVFSQARGWA